MNEKKIQEIENRYKKILEPLFFPENPAKNDIVKYFCSLLRTVGEEDKGWDPYLESRSMLEDLNNLLIMDLPANEFPDAYKSKWRLGLLSYSHLVEMDAPYEVLMNLLRNANGHGYSPNPFFDYLTEKQKKNYSKRGLYPVNKIELIKKASNEAGVGVGDIFDEFYNSKLRNAISHSDYILTDEKFRVRNGQGAIGAFEISLVELNEIITKSKIFLRVFFGLEHKARTYWGTFKGRALPYDSMYKGLAEVLVDQNEVMCGFKIHWPNNTESMYRRTKDGCEMRNCFLGQNLDVELFVGSYARKPGNFSPLVEHDQKPEYTTLEQTNETPRWPEKITR